MADPFIAEIVMFGGNFNPRGWALCNGQLLPIAQNAALFSLLGTTYGGDGRTTFGLPDLRGRVPMHPGNGPGLAGRTLGQKGGNQTTTLNSNNLPSHGHTLRGSGNPANTNNPSNNRLGVAEAYSDQPQSVSLNADSITNTGTSNTAFSNEMPYQCVNFIIALVGVFPSRN